MNDLRVELHGGLSKIDERAWNRLTGEHDPFVEYGFLRALETSESVGGESGWDPLHVTVWRGKELIGALPLYVKTHSYGEYVFDFAWAQGAMRARLPYYPKLTSMVPFTPATGTRILIAESEGRAPVIAAIVDGLEKAKEVSGAHSTHLLYLNEGEAKELEAHANYFPRVAYQFHWHQRVGKPYRDFDDFLSEFRAESRKQTKRERRKVSESGLRIAVLTGAELGDREWDALSFFYESTCDRKGSEPYLTPVFFEHLRASAARERVVAALAYDGEDIVAGTLNFEKGKCLFGRYWGARAEYDSLHFELCYYALIERAIARGYERVEAGAQGVHKIKRGFTPSPIRSVHAFQNESLADAVRRFLYSERTHAEMEMAELSEHTPFHRTK